MLSHERDAWLKQCARSDVLFLALFYWVFN